MSSSKFAERFHRETGETFNRFVARHRLEKARVLLRDSDWTIENIAFSCGMNASHLRRLMKRHYNMSPLEMRTNQRRSHAASKQLLLKKGEDKSDTGRIRAIIKR